MYYNVTYLPYKVTYSNITNTALLTIPPRVKIMSFVVLDRSGANMTNTQTFSFGLTVGATDVIPTTTIHASYFKRLDFTDWNNLTSVNLTGGIYLNISTGVYIDVELILQPL